MPQSSTKLLISEGAGDEAFLRELIKVRELKNFKVHKRPPEISGSGAFGKILKAIPINREYDDCSHIVLVADNDSNPDLSFASIVHQIRDAGGYGIPRAPRETALGNGTPSISVLMLPWDQIPGDLETVCFDLAGVQEPKKAICVSQFIDCVGAGDWPISQLSKLQLRCLISASCKKDPNTGLQYVWQPDRPKNLIPLHRNGTYLKKIVDYFKKL